MVIRVDPKKNNTKLYINNKAADFPPLCFFSSSHLQKNLMKNIIDIHGS